jgi:hypothetical protein
VYKDIEALVYFRPLNRNDIHFNLLKINKLKKKIRYYNSMADKDIIKGKAKLTRVNKLI